MRIKGESFVWALGALAQLNRTPFDAKLIEQQFPPPYTSEALHEAATSLGLKVGFKQVEAAELGQLTLPCLAILEPTTSNAEAGSVPLADPKVTPIAAAIGAERPPAEDAPAHRVVLIVSANADSVAFFDGASPNVRTQALQDFACQFAGQVLLFVRQVSEAKDDDRGQPTRAFGFSWFVPELLKHKHIWRDVLAASLVMQLMALATPLFTQVVIDNTLHAPA